MTKQGELIPQETQVVPAAPMPTTDAGSIMAVISRASSDPTVDVDKLERLLSMYERITSRQAEEAFSAAMAEVQSKLPTVLRDATNQQTNSNYARHETLSRAIKPVYTAEGFSLEFSEGETPKADHVRIVGVLRHRAGHSVTRFIDLKMDAAGIKGNVNKTDVHAKGSTFSYGRRYLTLLIFDVATGDDDDGNTGGRGEVIGDEQLSSLRDWISKANRTEEAICKWLKVETLEDLGEKDYRKALNALKKAANENA